MHLHNAYVHNAYVKMFILVRENTTFLSAENCQYKISTYITIQKQMRLIFVFGYNLEFVHIYLKK